MTTHELARKLLEGPNLPVAYCDGEYGTTLLNGDLIVEEECNGLFSEDWEDDPVRMPQWTPRADDYGRPTRLKADAPERKVVVIT